MELALEQAQRAEIAGEVPVGAVFVSDDKVIATSGNETIGLKDPTAHAEILVLRQAAQVKGNYRLGGSIYVTLEPCIMCMGALIQARIEHLIFGAYDKRAGAAGTIYDFSDASRRFFSSSTLNRSSQSLNLLRKAKKEAASPLVLILPVVIVMMGFRIPESISLKI